MNYTFHPAPACNMCGSESRKIMGRRLNQPQGLRPKSRVGISTTVVRCTDCGLIYADPLPIPRSIEDHYCLDPEQYWTPKYFDVPPDHLRAELARCRRLFPGAKSLLDIGAGVGRNMIAAIDNGFDVQGIEGSETFYKVAAERLGDRVQHAMIETADFPGESFDVVSFSAVLEHLYDPATSIGKALAWLKPGGIIHIEVPNADHLFNRIFNAYFWLARTDYVVNISPMHAPFHLYEFTEKTFTLNGNRSGYTVAHIDRYAGREPQDVPMAALLNKVLTPLMNATDTGSGMVVYLQKH